MTKHEAIVSGAAAAAKPSVMGWAVFGFLIPPLGILVAHCRSPKVPPLLLAAHDDDATIRVFEAQFVVTFKTRQVLAAWGGGVLGAVVTLLILAI